MKLVKVSFIACSEQDADWIENRIYEAAEEHGLSILSTEVSDATTEETDLAIDLGLL